MRKVIPSTPSPVTDLDAPADALPSAEALDAVAQEQPAKAATSGAPTEITLVAAQ